MPVAAADRTALLPLLPETLVGEIEHIEPVTLGLSGAGVYAVRTSRGEYVLRLRGPSAYGGSFEEQLRVWRRAADRGVAPAIVHVDESARAVISVRANGLPIAAALADPAQRGPVFASVVNRLRTLHAVDPSDVPERNPLPHTYAAWEAGRNRPGFPPWATALAPTLEAIARTLERDRRVVVSHNDVNPGNVLWDGTRAWLVDWDVAGLGHPYYDLATLALFLRLEDDVALALVERHDEAPLDDRSRATFRALRQLVGLLSGLTFLSLVEDLSVRPAPALADAPTLMDCYAAMRTGDLDLQSQRGRASMGLALLALGVASAER
jgi:Ser/Thr protein kinase RdoA (MazF antagonist)